jgi:hypothetical protein
LTLCYLIQHYSDLENYEECKIILDVINDISFELNKSLPTKWNDNTKNWLKNRIKKLTGTSGNITINNIPYYANIIIEKLNK